MNLPPATSEVAGRNQFAIDGFRILPAVLATAECDALADDLTVHFVAQQRTHGRRIGGVRNLFRLVPAVAELAVAPRVTALLKSLTGNAVFPVRAIFFDKTAEANWRVPWHQDLTIAVAERLEAPGFGGWSIKDEIVHVQPPTEILAGMITLRFHLDDCDATNGALKVIRGSHAEGKIASTKIVGWAESHTPVICVVAKGGAMAMRPLLLHSSSPATKPSHRRVLHIEYAAAELPNCLTWIDA